LHLVPPALLNTLVLRMLSAKPLFPFLLMKLKSMEMLYAATMTSVLLLKK
jgi:hypothetical protein